MRLGSNAVSDMVRGSSHGPATSFTGISIDSRSVAPGDLFVALAGPNHDGHDFVGQALQKAAGALVSRDLPEGAVPVGRTILRVEDTLAALQALARHLREARKLTVVAVTGSVGKTTTKEMAAGLLSSRFKTGRSQGNLNNAIGCPLEVARLAEDVEVAVLEMGMSTPGEIALLSELLRPDVAVVTAVAAVHVANFASLDDVMEAKGEILAGMDPKGTFVANADDPRSVAIGKRHSGRVASYGLSGSHDLFATATDVEETGARVAGRSAGSRFSLRLGSGRADVTLALPGRHNVSNFLAAAAIAGVLGLTAREAAAAAPSLLASKHRGEVRELAGGGLLYDDSYNSSPVALAAAFDAFVKAAGTRRKVAVVGEMLELGPESSRYHREAGRQIAARCDLLVAVRGPRSHASPPGSEDSAAALVEGVREAGLPEESVRFAPDAAAATELVRGLLRPGDALFVKGSRGVALDRLVEALAPEAPR
jgi:UDP-N-acetylmuramoyl-tripeptide--D-alanyl-D-alanine ligase